MEQRTVFGLMNMVSLATIEAATCRYDYNENQCNYNPKNYQLYLHILQPHLPSHLGALRPKILCLQHSP